ncbi:MAG: c-type cytochrome [Pirellulaceae bacterium]|nr:c-type cytochrome [Pirellulaceae bacterium]
MPATEDTLRNQRLMHAIFGASSMILLFATIWMFAADHSREWKGYQRKGRQVGRQLMDWEAFQFQTDGVVKRVNEFEEHLAAVRLQSIDNELFHSFRQQVDDYTKKSNAALRQIDVADAEGYDFAEIDQLFASMQESIAAGDDEKIPALRDDFVGALQQVVDLAKAKEKEFLRQRKFVNADYDAAKASVGIGVRDDLGAAKMQELQEAVNEQLARVQEKTFVYEESNAYRLGIQGILGQIVSDEALTERDLESSQADLVRLQASFEESAVNFFQESFPFLGKRWLELPILDAFNSPLEIDNHHYPLLTVDYNFKGVARYDRCTTCHQAIDKASVEDPLKPAFLGERVLTFELLTPDQPPAADEGEEQPVAPAELLRRAYGLRIAERGLVDRDDVTISFVRSSSLGAQASVAENTEDGIATGLELRQAVARNATLEDRLAGGLKVGDVVLAVNGNKVLDQQQLHRFLLDTAEWGQPVELTVRRGLPQPYASHPRIDLFVGPNSPHPIEKFGCTACHEGQGSATAFKWASHAPNDLAQREQWSKEHGWFNNHHWIFPMYPQRFAEASCLRCHHEVADLDTSERFPEPPAPKVSAGGQLISKYGCFGCHEVNGFNGPDTRVGPDLRLEPNFYAAALQVKHLAAHRRDEVDELRSQGEAGDTADGRLHDLAEIVDLASRVGADWEHELGARHQLVELLTMDADRPADDALGSDFGAAGPNLARALKDVDTPGVLRKVGPSLRFVGHKLDPTFMYDWILEPKKFRPSSKMPQFFGLHSHLQTPDQTGDLAKAQRFEPIEIHGIVAYLMDRTQTYEYAEGRDVATESEADEKVARGKMLFETRGCLACHTHHDFPEAQPQNSNPYVGDIAQGPDLSGLGDKLNLKRNVNGRRWLVSWLRNPSGYHVRTRMPNMLLEPFEQRDAQDNVTGVVDPIEDIAEYLLSDHGHWQPAEGALQVPNMEHLDELVLEHLNGVFHKRAASRYIEKGIPESMRAGLKGAEAELVVSQSAAGLDQSKKLLYVGRKAIAKYGCYGCHDIPGFEDAKPIGTGLADWGRKDPSKLDFAHITHLLHGQAHGHGDGHGQHHGDANDDQHADAEGQLDPYFAKLIGEHDRAGFAMQKIRQPRSYDYKNITNKGYNERLRMPQFPFTAEQREAVVTFVLGLVAQPPVAEYVHRPEGRTKAVVEGRQVLEKFNCGGCHVLEPERWSVAYQAGDFRIPPTTNAYPFMPHRYTAGEVKESLHADRRDRMHVVLSGASSLSNEDGFPVVMDEEGDEVDDEEEYDSANVSFRFDLWRPTLLEGHSFDVGLIPLEIPNEWIQRKYPPRGGNLTRYLLPRVVELEREVNPSVKGSEAWGWLPPPLVGQGAKTQSAWLHDFLLDPHEIRPAAFLRMPKFNMSSAEATKLVNYFSAMDRAEYPYEYDSRKRSGYIASAERTFRDRLAEAGRQVPDVDTMARFKHAMQIVTDNNYCVKCHIIGDPSKGGFQPDGPSRAQAPNLANVFQRLRPDYVRRWIANPKQILPYTGMPVNIPFDPAAAHLGGVSQDLFPGTSMEQLDALVDMLMNFDVYSESRSPIAPLVKPAPVAVPQPEGDDVAGTAE